MISGVLTLFNWSLRSDARSFWPHVVRAGFAVFMLLSIAAAFVDAFGTTGPGLKYFMNISRLNVLMISVSGISYFVSAVTEEKDAGTLSLLRLAGVTPLAIILGKSTSRLISALMLLVIQIPFTFLAITLGGVTWIQIIASYAALAAWMALVCNLALFCSVRCGTSGRAASMATVLLLGFFTIRPLVLNALPLLPPGWLPTAMQDLLRSLAEWQATASITDRLTQILNVSSVQPELLSSQFWSSLAAAAALFVVSTLGFDRWSAPATHPDLGESALVRRFTVGRCWRFPIIWKDFLFFTGGRAFFLAKLLAYGAIVWGFIYFQQITQPWNDRLLSGDLAWTALLILLLVLNVELLLYSSGSLSTEVRLATLSSISLLPLQPTRVLTEKAAACTVALIPISLWVLVVYSLDSATINRRCSATMVVTVLVIMLLSSHLTVLLSLYTRWAALPLAVLLTAACFLCCPMLMLATFALTDAVARSHNFQLSLLIGSIVNLVWVWLFLLLPMEIEIVNRWNRLSQESP